MNKSFLRFSFVLSFLFLTSAVFAQVKVNETTTTIPTYLVSDPELSPYFFTGRTYQGAAGHIYPYPIYDVLTDERVDREYKYLTLENEYTEIGVLPEIGGRIFSAVDKESGYNFFYRQHVIRPALIGMIGSWISGGVEWNIPHHHRASSTLNSGYEVVENEDGSKTIWIGETELRQRLKWNIGLTIFPGKSYVEATFQMQNRTPMMQSFLYWANVSVHANKDYQVQFPPETLFGTTHSKTNYSDWPYSRKDADGKPVDDSWWNNWAGSNSTFAVNYTDDFLVGYDFGQNAGTAHWANHHVVPGKKFFLWGTESVWNEMLTEEDGAYLELMVGTYSDNQPDYSWIGPNEVRVTKQYWYPIKEIGGAKNLTLEAAVNIERTAANSVMIGFNATSLYKGAKVLLKDGEKVLVEKTIDIDPNSPYIQNVTVNSLTKDENLFVALYDAEGNELVSYIKKEKADVERPHPADRPKTPSEYETVEELLLAAQRLEEFHNARVDAIPYYEEALKRDPLNSRANVNLGIFYARQAEWTKAEKHLQNAYMRLTGLHYMPEVDKTGILYHTNPKDGEMLYYLGVVSLQLGKTKEAEAFFWKSTWYPGFQSASHLYLSQIYWAQGKTADALSAVDNSIALSGNSTQSKFNKAYYLSKLGKVAEARVLLNENIAFDHLDFLSRIYLAMLDKNNAGISETIAHMGIPLQEVVEVTTFMNAVGAYDDAVSLLDYVMASCPKFASTPMQKNAVEPFTVSPLLNYMAGYYSNLAGKKEQALSYYQKAATMSPDYFFPSRVEELNMLNDVIATNPSDSKAYYYLGNLLYFYNQTEDAVLAWQKSAEVAPNYGMVYRNLGFVADEKLGDKLAAVDYYKKAIAIDNTNPKFFNELDILEEELKVPSKERLARMDKNKQTIFKHDDATSRLVYLYVENGDYDKALSILNTRHFRVWEGGRTVYNQFVDAHILKGINFLDKKQNKKALDEFLVAGTFPRNLETNELSTGPIVARVAYFQGLAYKALGQNDKAAEAFHKCISASTASSRNSGGTTNDSKYYLALSHRQLGDEAACNNVLSEMITLADAQLNSTAPTTVDIYSKFGEDGSGDAIKAQNLYLKGLAKFAQGNKAEAKTLFTQSLEFAPSSVWCKHYLTKTK